MIVSNVVDGCAWGLFDSLLPTKLGVEGDFVDITDLDAVRAAVRTNTRLIHTEAVANPDLRVADIAALATIARDAGALLKVDSTFTPPPMLRPHRRDQVRGDAPCRRRHRTVQRLAHHARIHHPAASAETAVRERRGQRPHSSPTTPRITYVVHPGLPNDPDHALASTQFNGYYGGVVSFAIAGHHADRLRFVNDLRLITSAVSLGHDETLIAYEQYPDERAAVFATPFRDHGLIRLAAGLEAADDLIADLHAALTTASEPAAGLSRQTILHSGRSGGSSTTRAPGCFAPAMVIGTWCSTAGELPPSKWRHAAQSSRPEPAVRFRAVTRVHMARWTSLAANGVRQTDANVVHRGFVR